MFGSRTRKRPRVPTLGPNKAAPPPLPNVNRAVMSFATLLHRWAALAGGTLYVLAIAIGAAVGQAPGVELSPVIGLGDNETIAAGSPLLIDGELTLITTLPSASDSAQLLRVRRSSATADASPADDASPAAYVTELLLPTGADLIAVTPAGASGFSYLYLDRRGDSAALVLATHKSLHAEASTSEMPLSPSQAAFAKTPPTLTSTQSPNGRGAGFYLEWHAPSTASGERLIAGLTVDGRGRIASGATVLISAPSPTATSTVALTVGPTGKLHAATHYRGSGLVTVRSLAPGAERFAEAKPRLPKGTTIQQLAWSRSPNDLLPHLLAITESRAGHRRTSYAVQAIHWDAGLANEPTVTQTSELTASGVLALARHHDYAFTETLPLPDGRVAFLIEGKRAARAHPKATHATRKTVYGDPVVVILDATGQLVDTWSVARRHGVMSGQESAARAALTYLDGSPGVLLNDHPANLLRAPTKRTLETRTVQSIFVLATAPAPATRFRKRPVYEARGGMYVVPTASHALAGAQGGISFVAVDATPVKSGARRVQVGFARFRTPVQPADHHAQPLEDSRSPSAASSLRRR